MPTPRATQARDELGLKARLHGTPPDDVGLDAGSSLREGTGLWGWLWGRGDFPLRRGVMFILTFVLVSRPVLTTSTCLVAWPQGDKFLGGDL